MNKLLCVSLLVFIAPAFASYSVSPMEIGTIAKSLSANTVKREHSSVKDNPIQRLLSNGTTGYPTQIVRMEADVKSPSMTCDEVFQQIDEFFNNHITYDKFYYNTINYCVYDPTNNFAKKFIINSYFDPLDQGAITYLQKYIADHNGRDLLGSPFYVESAQGLIVSLNLDAGVEDAQNSSVLFRLQHENSSHYFDSNYNMQTDLISDVRQRFYTNDPNLILPFIDKWFKTSTWLFQRVLSQSDYVELQPELIFLMDKGEKIFTPFLRMYYASHCSKFPNRHCL